MYSNRDTIRQTLEEGRFDQLRTILGHMSNMEFRRMERVVREDILPSLPNEKFWTALRHLIIYRRQAFLSSIMAVERLAKEKTLDFDNEDARQLYGHLVTTCPEAIDKLQSMALPLLHTEEQIDGLFRCFHTDDPRKRTALLLKAESPLTYYVLFKNLRQIPDHQELVRKCSVYIMKRNNDMAFNMASIMRSYFGISDLRSNLSLHIEPYEHSLLDRSYETFLNFLHGKKPTVNL